MRTRATSVRAGPAAAARPRSGRPPAAPPRPRRMGRCRMTLVLLLALGSGGAAASAWGLNRGGRAAQGGAVVGGVAAPGHRRCSRSPSMPRASAPARSPDGVGLLDGRLIPNDYLRFAIALWALDAALIVFIAWLAGGLAALRGLLPALLASIVGGTVALAATNLVIGAAAAGATGPRGARRAARVARPGDAPGRRTRAAGHDPLDGPRPGGDHAARRSPRASRSARCRRERHRRGARPPPAARIPPGPRRWSGCSCSPSRSPSPCAPASSRSTFACRG